MQSEHSEALHPNEEKEEDDAGSTKSKRKLGCCLRTWVKLDELILRDLLIYNYKPDTRTQQRLFFDMYHDQADDVAAIIKDAALDPKAENDADLSHHSAQLREKVQKLKRRNTLKKEQLDVPVVGINGGDDFEKMQ